MSENDKGVGCTAMICVSVLAILAIIFNFTEWSIIAVILMAIIPVIAVIYYFVLKKKKNA